MHFNIADLVKNALIDVGCNSSMIGNLDGHSTIALDFRDLPSIYITSSEEGVWVWSRLAECNESLLRHRAYELLNVLMTPFDFSLNGFPCLAKGEGYLEFKALIKEDSLLDRSRFTNALISFFGRVDSLNEMVNR